jgi:hypothetical protein
LFACNKVVQLTFFVCLVRSNKKQTFISRNLATKVKRPAPNWLVPDQKHGSENRSGIGFLDRELFVTSALDQFAPKTERAAKSVVCWLSGAKPVRPASNFPSDAEHIRVAN